MKTFKRHRDYGFFDQDIRLSKLSKLGDPLEKLNKGIDFELFRSLLEGKLATQAKGKGGRPAYDYILMFKVLILQRYYNLSDDQVEYQINDRMSFMRFLNLSIADDVPDSKTIWHFKERLTDLELIEPLFQLFLEELEKLEQLRALENSMTIGGILTEQKLIGVDVPDVELHALARRGVDAGEIDLTGRPGAFADAIRDGFDVTSGSHGDASFQGAQ
jgi:transposase